MDGGGSSGAGDALSFVSVFLVVSLLGFLGECLGDVL